MAKKDERIPIDQPIQDLETAWDDGTSAYIGTRVEEFIKGQLSELHSTDTELDRRTSELDQSAVKGVRVNGQRVDVNSDGIASIIIEPTPADDTLDPNSTNPVENRVIAQRLLSIEDGSLADSTVEVNDDSMTVHLLNSRGGELTQFDLPMLGGSGEGEGEEGKSIRLTASLPTAVVKEGESCAVTFNYDTVYLGGDNNGESVNLSGTVTVEVLRGTVVAMRKTMVVNPGTYTTDITTGIAAGSNDIRITAEVYDPDAEKTRRKSRIVKLYVSAMHLTSDFSLTDVVRGGGLSGSAIVRYSITGTGNKTISLYLDGNVQQTQTQRQSGTRSGEFIVSLSSLAPGSRHSIQLRAEVNIDGVDLVSETVYMDILIAGGNEPWAGVKMSVSDGTICAGGANPTVVAVQYEPLEIEYAVWHPSETVTTAEVRSGSTVLSQVRASRQTYTYRLRRTVTEGINLVVAVGRATTGMAVRPVSVIVEDSPIDVGIAEGALAYRLSAEGRSNAESNPAQWGADAGITTTFVGVDWDTSGWTGESLKLMNGAKAIVGLKPFATDVKSTGMTIEMLMRVSNVSERGADVVSCMASGKGLAMTTDKISYLTGATVDYNDEDGNPQTRAVGLTTNYQAGDWMSVVLVIGKESESNTMELYINGDRVGADLYGQQFSFSQGNSAADITIDSAGADVEIRDIMVYNRDLSDDEVLDNTIATRDSASEMMQLYEDNQVIGERMDEDGNSVISMTAVSNKGRGTLLVVRENKLEDVFETNDKSKNFTSDVYYTPSAEAAAQGAKPWELHNCYIRIQGTSSTKYPAKNIRIYLNKGETGLYMVYDGQTITDKSQMKVPLRNGTPAQTVLCAKKDYSDSTMSLNTGGAKLFNDGMKKLGLLTPPQRHQYEQTGDIDQVSVRSAIDGLPIDIFVASSVDADAEFVGQYNLNNEKSKSGEVFGMEGVAGYNPTCPIALESLNNSQALCLFQCPGNVDTTLAADFDKAFEFNYPEDVTWSTASEAQKTAIRGLISWIKACVPAGADPDDISTFVSPKFRDEAQAHFDVDYLCTYYLHTDYKLGVDQRAKNILWRTWDGAIWYPTYYDGDTQMGKSNDSYMSYDYNTTRTTYDARMGKYAFEGYSSWLWCLVLANFADKLRECAQKLRVVEPNEVTLRMYEVEQMGAWSEREYNKSGYLAYIRPAMKQTYGQTWPFIFALQGRNKPHRRYMVENRNAVLDAKYGCGDFRNDNIDLYMSQGAGARTVFAATLTEDYAVGWGTNNVPFMQLSDVVPAGVSTNITINDTQNSTDPLRIYGASRMQTLALASGSDHLQNALNMNKCTSLRQLDLSVPVGGHASTAWYMVVDGCRQLREVNLRNQTDACTGAAGSRDLDLSKQARLVKLDARGVDAHTVSIAAGAPVTELWMPDTLQKLSLRALPNLQMSGLHINTWSTVSELSIDNCPGLSQDASLVMAWLDGKSAEDADCSLTLSGIAWQGATVEQMMRMARIGRVSISGRISLSTAPTLAQAMELMDALGEDIFTDGAKLRVTAPGTFLFAGDQNVNEGTTEATAAVVRVVTLAEGLHDLTVTASTTSSATVHYSVNGAEIRVWADVTGANRQLTITACARDADNVEVTASTTIGIKALTYPSSFTLEAPVYANPGETLTVYANVNGSGYTGDYRVEWERGGALAANADIVQSDKTMCVVRIDSADIEGQLMLTARAYKGGSSGTFWTGSVTIPIINSEVIMTSETNPEFMAFCHQQGWSASPALMTKNEAESVTSNEFGSLFNSKVFNSLAELRYFTGITSLGQRPFWSTIVHNVAGNAVLEIPPSHINSWLFQYNNYNPAFKGARIDIIIINNTEITGDNFTNTHFTDANIGELHFPNLLSGFGSAAHTAQIINVMASLRAIYIPAVNIVWDNDDIQSALQAKGATLYKTY